MDDADQLRISAHETVTVLPAKAGASGLLVEADYEPHGDKPPTHFHPLQDEHFTVLQGELTVEINGAVRELTAGEELTIKRGEVHRMWNSGETVARTRWLTEPALSTEAWFQGLARLHRSAAAAGRSRPPIPAFARHAAAHRDSFRLIAGPRPVGDLLVRALAKLPAR